MTELLIYPLDTVGNAMLSVHLSAIVSILLPIASSFRKVNNFDPRNLRSRAILLNQKVSEFK